MIRLFHIFILLCLATTTAHAQSPGLSGLKEIHLLIEGLSKDAEACGITQQLIRDAFMYPASGAKFNVVDTTAAPTFYIQISTLRLHPISGCASSINAQVYVTQNVTLDFSNTGVFAEVVLWNGSYLVSGSPADHPTQVKEDVEDLTKEFITKWNLSNKNN